MSTGPSLYRRHRPRTFADVVGQEPVVRTLRNAVEREMVHHAYLFVGSRGTGKTSMAKILAACLNCERGPTTEPCGECDSCIAIANATSLDVIEMDAASNNSVDDIRDLREAVAYAPVSGRHKVYILDEAHMLSSQAWNAFLKTLEEPPPNTIFVLATTDPQKVPATVVDRCHRFDFRRPGADQIATVVRRTAAAESIELPDDAVAVIARQASGSFRDALGTLEQLVTYSGRQIALADVLAVLGVTEDEQLFEALDAVGSGDSRRALLAVARCCDSGRDPAALMRDLEGHAGALLTVQTLGSEVPAELAVTPERDARLAEQAGQVSRAQVVRLLDLIAIALEAVKAGADGRTQLELALVKAAAPEVDAATPALLARLERLEAALGRRDGGAAAPSLREAPAQGPEAATGGGEAPVQAPQSGPPVARSGGVAAAAVAVAAAEPVAVAASEPVEVVEGASACEVAAAPVPAAVLGELELDLGALQRMWPAVVETIRAENAMLAAVICDAQPVAVAGTEVEIAFPPTAAFLRRKAEDRANRMAVAAALRAVTGRPLRPSYSQRDEEPVGARAPALSEDELIARLMAEFDAQELPADEAPRGAPGDDASDASANGQRAR